MKKLITILSLILAVSFGSFIPVAAEAGSGKPPGSIEPRLQQRGAPPLNSMYNRSTPARKKEGKSYFQGNSMGFKGQNRERAKGNLSESSKSLAISYYEYRDLAGLVLRMRNNPRRQEGIQFQRDSLSQQDFQRFIAGIAYDRVASRVRPDGESAQLEEIASAIAYADREKRVFANYNPVGGDKLVSTIVYLYHFGQRAADPAPYYSISDMTPEDIDEILAALIRERDEPSVAIWRYTPRFDIGQLESHHSLDLSEINALELNNLLNEVGDEVIADVIGNVMQEITELLTDIEDLELYLNGMIFQNHNPVEWAREMVADWLDAAAEWIRPGESNEDDDGEECGDGTEWTETTGGGGYCWNGIDYDFDVLFPDAQRAPEGSVGPIILPLQN